MIKMITLKCPACGANLSIEENLKQCFCRYCGAKILIDDGSTMHTYRKIDEARIREAEAREVIRLRELEAEEKKRMAEEKREKTNSIAEAIQTVVLVIALIIILLFSYAICIY